MRALGVNKPLNIGIVGASFAHSIDGRENWGVRTHLPALKSLPDLFNIVAVCTSRMESARETAQQFNVPHAFDDYHKMMALPGLDAVSVVVRPKLHHPVSMAALEAGKHVFCVWPLALDVREAREMADLAQQKGLKTATGMQGHFMPVTLRMRQLIADGYIGRPLQFSAASFVSNYITPRPNHRQWLFQSEEGGAAAYRCGHLLERVTSILGDVKSVSADLANLVSERPRLGGEGVLKGDQVDNINLLLQMDGGLRGTLQVSFTAWFGTGQRLEIYGTEGMLLLTRPDRNAQQAAGINDPGYLEDGELYGKRVDMASLLKANRPPEQILGDIERIPFEEAPDIQSAPLAPGGSARSVWYAFKAFGEAIQSGREFQPDFGAGLVLHQVLEAAEVSTRTRRWVDVGAT